MTTMTDRVNGVLASVAIKAPCRYATTANITLSGLGTRSGAPWTSALSDGDRILVTSQTDAVENGIYIASTSDWVRAPDFDGNRDIVQGTRIPVVTGSMYEVTSANPITIGTDEIVMIPETSPDQRISVLAYYSGSGDFDSALLSAYTDAVNRGGGIIWFPWRLAGYTISMFTVSHPKIHFHGDQAEIIYRWSAASQASGLNGGTYRASPAFLIKPSAGNNSFRGLRFSQYAGFPTTYSGSFTSAATFAAIIVQRADHVHIVDCHFDTDSGRAAYWRGGNYGVFKDNTVINGSIVAHIGETSDTLFWDDTTDIAVRYSPWLMSVSDNTFVGSNTTRLAIYSVFMTGVVAPHVCDNKFYGLDVDGAGTGAAIYIYANDLGCFNQNGTGRTRQQMRVSDNHIFGTVQYAIRIVGDSDSGDDTSMYGSVLNNTVDVTGGGIYVERGVNLRIGYNHVVSTASPLTLADSCMNLESSLNHYECTSSGSANRTIAILSTAELTHTWFIKDKVITPASDIYAMDTSNAARGFEGGGIKGCVFAFGSQSSSARILQLSECSGSVYVDDNIFDIQDTGITNRQIVSIDEESGAATTVYFRGNKVLSTNATSFVSRGVTINNSDTCVVADNDVGNVSIICSGDVFVSDNNIVNGVALVVPLTVEGAARVKAHDNTIRHSLTTNAICAEFIDCARANLHDNTLVATSTSVMARATTSGILNVRGNNYVNGSTGAPVGVTGTGMIGGDLGAYFTESGSGTAWTDANRLSAAIMKIGTVFWNSSDNAPNYSDGTDWRSAAGVVT